MTKTTEEDLRVKREFEYCPTCGGDLDTGWQCTRCSLDWRDWVLMPPTIEVEGEQ